MPGINGIAHIQLTVSNMARSVPFYFEDPDGIRIEANFVPGKGHLTESNDA